MASSPSRRSSAQRRRSGVAEWRRRLQILGQPCRHLPQMRQVAAGSLQAAWNQQQRQSQQAAPRDDVHPPIEHPRHIEPFLTPAAHKRRGSKLKFTSHSRCPIPSPRETCFAVHFRRDIRCLGRAARMTHDRELRIRSSPAISVRRPIHSRAAIGPRPSP